MKTILLISPYWKEHHRWMVSSVKLAELWQRIGYRVVVVCMGRAEVTKYGRAEVKKNTVQRRSSDPQGHTISVEHVSDTLVIHRVPDLFLPDPWNYGIAWGFSGHAVRLARELKPDVIVVNKILFWSSLSLLRLRFVGFRVLLLTDALVGITWWPRGVVARVCAALYAWTAGWLILLAATKVVFFHPQPTKILRLLGVTKKASVVPTGIDPAPYFRAEKKQDAVNVTYLGRMESIKGAEDFVAAVLIARRDCPDIRARAVGWYKESHPLVAAHGHEIEFTGLRSDVPDVLANTDIFVLPSYSEGLSNALMEAMASGCACIASDVGGNRFLVENGVSGFLFPAGDREALASHIRRLARDAAKRESLGLAARKRIETTFNWEKIGRVYGALF